MPAVTKTKLVSSIIVWRGRRWISARRKPANKMAVSCSGAFLLAFALLCLFLALEYTSLTRDLPAIESLPLLAEPPDGLYLQPTRFYDRSGEHLILELQNPAARGAQYLYFNETSFVTASATAGERAYLPAEVISATIAASDPAFWSHNGYSLAGILQYEHPTIAQRLVAALLLQHEPKSLRRALRERLLAAQITQRYGRQKVIEWYLNTLEFGSLAYGVDSGARLYFGQPASELNLAQAASLAVIADNLSLARSESPDQLIERQRRLLWEMLHARMIQPQAAIDAAREPPIFIQNPDQTTTIRIFDLKPAFAPTFVQMAFEQVAAALSRSRLERGGLRILTTLDYDLQQQLTCASLSLTQKMAPDAAGTIPIPDDNCPAARLLPSMPGNETPTPANLAADGVILEPQTGEILALNGPLPPPTVSGYLAAHPAGSLSTLLIYMTAFTRGLSPASLLWDVPPDDPASLAQNFDQQYHGPVRLRMALVNDYLAPAGQVLIQVGVENVWRTARQLGLTYPERQPAKQPATAPDALSLLRSVDLIEISHAFSVFANQGVLSGREISKNADSADEAITASPALLPLQPKTILRVDDIHGQTLLDWSATQSRPILTPELAYLMTHVLSDETARWPSLGHPNPLEIGRPAAAKLGRTPDGNSNWVIGYTPQRFVGVWVGQTVLDGGKTGIEAHILQSAAAGLWHAIMQHTSRYLPYQTFDMPAGLTIQQVCDPSGLLPTAACPNVIDEVFLAGNEPTQLDTLYRLTSVNRETGRLATIFSPPDQVEPRAYISVPPEAAQWAEHAGLETAPEMYDILPAQLPAPKNSRISAPGMFARVRGRVTINGSIHGENLAFYRLQVGQGANPSFWYQVGEDSQQPITDGQLAIWDATRLDGLYALQLLLVHQDQSAERSTILVTVDNQPPQINLLSPDPEEVVLISARPTLVILAEIEDNLGIDQVAFLVDGRPLARLFQAPFAVSWPTVVGAHTLKIVATDEAGNTSEAQVHFKVR